MDDRLAPNSHSPPGVLPDRDKLRSQEMGHLLRGILRVRSVFLPISALFLTLIVLYDPARWKIVALATVVALQFLVVGFDRLRLRRIPVYSMRYLTIDVALMAVLQTCIVALTGAVESPLIFIYSPLGITTGLLFGPGRRRWLLVGLVSLLLWLMALLGLLGWVPRTVPSFLGLGPGFYDRPIYVVTKLAILNAVVVVGSVVGVAAYRAMSRMLAQAIDARQQALEALADRNRELVYLAGAIAHELKNPLASIQGLVQLLARPGSREDPERRQTRFEVLQQEVTRMRGILDDFLNFSRPLGELTLEEVRTTALCEEITALHEGLARSKGVHMQVPSEARTLRGDPRKLKQALVNLLQNALEATPSGGTVQWIVREAPGGDELAIGVSDSGTGIAPELLPRAADAGVTTKPGGSGIGLAVARAIAEQHGGSLSLTNLPAGGCEALLHLPLQLPHVAEESTP